MKPQHFVPARSRREFLMRSCGGLGALAVSSMLQEGTLEAAKPVDPLAPKKPDHPPTAKSVIWLFLEGGPSHIDLFDPKPELDRLAGQPMPESYGKVITAMGTASNTLMPSTAQVEAVRRERHVGVRLVPQYRGARRRDGHVPLMLGRWPESRRLGVPDEHRLHSRRTSRRWARGLPMDSAPPTTTCPLS